MNNKNKFRFAILLFGVLSAFITTACSDNNSPDDPSQGENTLPVKQVSLSRKTAYGNDWIYYSLEKGKEVSVSEESHAENTDWDIAFNRYNVRTNSGASGKGKGGALLTNIKDMAACTTVPQGTFTVDAAYTITAPGTPDIVIGYTDDITYFTIVDSFGQTSVEIGKCSKAGVCFPDSCITICQNFPIG